MKRRPTTGFGEPIGGEGGTASHRPCLRLLVALLLLVPMATAFSTAVSGGDDLADKADLGRRTCAEKGGSTGGTFSLSGAVRNPEEASIGGGFLFTPSGESTEGTAGCCPCSSTVFNDGFESGDTSMWSGVAGLAHPIEEESHEDDSR